MHWQSAYMSKWDMNDLDWTSPKLLSIFTIMDYSSNQDHNNKLNKKQTQNQIKNPQKTKELQFLISLH